MTDDLFSLLREDLKEGFNGVHARLDQLNGRVRDAEQDIAILKDRGGRTAAAWGTGSGAVIIGIVEALKAYLGK